LITSYAHYSNPFHSHGFLSIKSRRYKQTADKKFNRKQERKNAQKVGANQWKVEYCADFNDKEKRAATRHTIARKPALI